MNFQTAEELLNLCKEHGLPISKVMLEREKTIGHMSEEDILKALMHSYDIMKNAIKSSLTEDLTSMGGLIGGEAKKIYKRKEDSACGSLVSKAISYAMGVLEVNTSMGLIVAAPTAGSSGVIPGVFIAIQEERGFSDDKMLEALLNAGAVGYLITRNATVSGAEGGCQAEIGSASAMAASAVVELLGGTPAQCLDAASTALANILGLVCDPVGGLVEAPCQNRNGMGASNALISAEITLAGIKHLVPFDETVEAMYKVGRSIPFELRETALGGLAATKTACQRCGKCD
ncbi:L-serine ammonia-lyase, iron-sulfur-dependent, subunit alpha [Niameybacter massiliensis]|uniref:L-serine ammonia-lyase, iron-sulfur-dependent, subunit alpha n=1 Tax=Niameybacter massiliensis TaxID=1658108 RepID=UPI0006B64712|nr:L-serine ammonia-lyase, iron-sulfur-dependent, subunit alpha [Niameybacter massiliensis]